MPVFIPCRKYLYSILTQLNKICHPHHHSKSSIELTGLYPPDVNLSKEQSIQNMNKEIYKLIDYLKSPHLSHLKKN